MCLRNIHGGIENPSLAINEWNYEDFKVIFNKDVLDQIDHVNFCGDFGDPILNNDLTRMCRYLKDNSNVSVTINTNGSARTVVWWNELADAMPKQHSVEFAIDGLQETHSLYRIGTDFTTILRNATAFMEAGGTADWMFIKFKHNQHEVELARTLATSLGFNSFKVKHSKRFGNKFPVLDRVGNITHYIEQSDNSDIKPVTFIDLKDYKDWKSKISCFTLDTREIYIDAHKHVMPCCLIGSFLYSNYDIELYKQYNLYDEMSVTSIAREVQLDVFKTIDELGGLISLDANQRSIKEIMNTTQWQTLIQKKWDSNSSSPCTVLCSDKSPFIKIEDQINRDT
jgi:hypothetical protein